MISGLWRLDFDNLPPVALRVNVTITPKGRLVQGVAATRDVVLDVGPGNNILFGPGDLRDGDADRDGFSDLEEIATDAHPGDPEIVPPDAEPPEFNGIDDIVAVDASSLHARWREPRRSCRPRRGRRSPRGRPRR